ncbi:AMP-binding protein [Reyranella sp. CPCC 100927]|uniref:AMP-binding protein n=1 Tax=Reyranella sp. CPCC 100927 TaxID=2599616 RepID=UPI0011B5E1D8|nr:AMP-binding protein [Reyranella sp. CPCC 100927]TWS99404.1 AMP-binding protein [Reyranella sp. CPCC 100927]
MVSDAVHFPTTYADMMVTGLDRFPDRVALIEDTERLTYRALKAQVSRTCQALQELGLRRGDGLAQLSNNRIAAVVTQLAAYVLGLRYTPLHPLGSPDDHAYILQDAGIAAFVYDPAAFETHVQTLLAQSVRPRHILAHGSSAIAMDLAADARLRPPAELIVQAGPHDVVALLYTGGTSGRSKGVTLSNRAMIMNVFLTLTEWEWPTSIRFLCSTPITHATGCMLVPIFLRGGTIVLQSGFNAADFLTAIDTHRITATFLVPTMIYGLIEEQKRQPRTVSSLETVIYGGAPISPARLKEAIETFGPVFQQIYSQSEAPNCATVLRKSEHDPVKPGRLASCGRPMAGITVAILDEDGQPVPRGQVGEICFRGPSLMEGYWQKSQETADAFSGGWLHTGDLAHQDDEGFFHIVDRRKDMIVTGGFNIYPREIEDVLTAHPAVAAAAVIGIPDDKWGEAVKAVVIRRAGATVADRDLIAFVKEKKGSVAAPKSVDFVPRLPTTSLGKPDKKAIRARYWGDQQRQVN